MTSGLDFDGSADYIETNVAGNLAASITMMAWFKSDDAGSILDDNVAQRFISQRRAAADSRLALGINNDRIAVYWHDGTDVVNEGTATLTTNQFYHAAVTYDGTTVRLYVNGVEEANWAESSMTAPTADTFEIGAVASSRYFDGVLDDVQLHTRALCAAEINVIYRSSLTRIVRWQEVDPYP